VDNELFDYSPITERPPIRWPGGARVAFYIGLSIEHSLVPDPLDDGRRDDGVRVGIWLATSDEIAEHYQRATERHQPPAARTLGGLAS
jgi:allantoinase